MNLLKHIALLFVICTALVTAQSFSASVNSNKVGSEDRFELSFTFSGEDIQNLRAFNPPDFNNFMILSGPNYSSSMQIINGSVSASQTYSYYLQPKSIGKFTIGSASVDYKGKSYKSNPLTIEVIKGTSAPKQNKDEESTVSEKDISENLFIKASADKQKVYQGEQVTVTYKLYTRLTIASQMSISKLPSYQGFWSEEIETSNNIIFTTEVLNGKQYRVGVLKKAALFPSQTGELTVSPFELKVPVLIQKKRKRSNNLFDDFFNDPFFGQSETMEYNIKSNTIKVTAVPLPDNNVPSNFTGAVGNYSLTANIDKKKTKTNEPISLKIDITGSGNIQLLNIPEIELPNGFEKYEPKTSEQINRSGKISGKKSIEYLLVPRSVGEKEIPPVKYSYFDPAQRSYVTLQSSSFTITVEQGNVISSGNYANKEDIKMLGEDIRYIKTSAGDLDRQGSITLYQYGFWTAVLAPLFALTGLAVWKRRNEKLLENVQLLKFQRAEKIARNRFKTAKALMSANKQEEFYSEISQALFGYLEDKLHIPKAEFSLDKAAEELKLRNVDDTLISELKITAEKCEYIRFAPQSDGKSAMNEIYNEFSRIVINIERSFGEKKYV